MSEKDVNRLMHDMNSGLSALFQALQVVQSNWRDDPETIDKLLPLSIQKVEQLMEDWDKVKDHLRSK